VKKIFVLITFILVFCSDAFCFNIRTDTRKVELQIKSGQTYSGTITIDNPSESDIAVRVYLEDFSYVAPFDGAKQFFPPATTPRSAAAWITFTPQEFTLGAFAKKSVNYVVTVPQGVSGGYYAVLFFETSLGTIPDQQSGSNILVKGRLGSLFMLQTEDSIRKAEVGDFSTDALTINGTLSNKGNTALACKGNFYVMNSAGEVFDRGVIKDMFLSAGDNAVFSMALGQDLAAGAYTMVVSFDLEQGKALVAEIDFSKGERGQITITDVRK
jgi:hypothetical protein